MLEPRDGDFVAYIDALQRESAARLAQQHVVVTETTAASKTTGQFFEEKPRPAVVPNLQQAIGRLVGRDTDAKVVKALVAAVAGAAFLLSWLGKGGFISFIIAAVLLAYAVPRLLADLLAYWTPRPAAGEGLPEGAVLLGAVPAPGTRRFALPAPGGTLVIYSLAHQRVVDALALGAGERAR